MVYPFGKYCGPYWSDGRVQPSVVGLSDPESKLDGICKAHDAEYATGGDLLKADLMFARSAYRHGVAGLAMAAIVGAQAGVRSLDFSKNHMTTQKNKTKSNLRGGAQQSQLATKAKKTSNASMVTHPTAPVSIGTVFRKSPPRITRTADSAQIIGHDFIGTVECNGITTFGLGKSALLSPAYFYSSMLGTTAKSFEKYRWKRLRVHYVPRVATSTIGQVILTSNKSALEVGLQPESGTFLSRAMTQGNATFGPLWTPNYIDIECPNDWKMVDAAIHNDLDDAIAEELLVYTQSSSTGQVGYLWAEYEIQFLGALYQPHAALFPYNTGPGQRITLTDTADINAVGDDWNLADPAGELISASAPTTGTIFRLVFDIQGSTAAAGSTFSGGWRTHATYRSTSTALQVSNSAFPLGGGYVFYGAVVGLNLVMYTSIESAIAGIGSGQMFHNLATTLRGNYVFDVGMVRYGPDQLLRAS